MPTPYAPRIGLARCAPATSCVRLTTSETPMKGGNRHRTTCGQEKTRGPRQHRGWSRLPQEDESDADLESSRKLLPAAGSPPPNRPQPCPAKRNSVPDFVRINSFAARPLFLQENRFTQLGIPRRLFVACDSIHLPGVLVVNRLFPIPIRGNPRGSG